MSGGPGGCTREGPAHYLRAPIAAGTFYPSRADRLRALVQGLLAEADREVRACGLEVRAPKAVIAPHAGYQYSGPVAASAYVRVARGRGVLERVVLIGPAHRVALGAIAMSSAEAFATPFGALPVDVEGWRAVLSYPWVVVDDDAHAMEHSLEAHLPFVQEALGEVALLPMLVGEVPARLVADILAEVWGGPETLVVASSDLSHFYGYATATLLDRETAEAVVHCRPDGVGLDRACGVFAVRGLLEAARRHRLAGEMVDLRNSGDTVGGQDRVVGYGAFVFNSELEAEGPSHTGRP
jgi:MEMO1 family protein